MARTVTQGNPTSFTTDATSSDNSDQEISYQWQIGGVDISDGSSVPTKSDIGGLFKAVIVDSLGLGYRESPNNGGSGVVGTSQATATGTSTRGVGHANSVRFNTTDQVEKYFTEFKVINNTLSSGNGWFGVLDQEHWDGGPRNSSVFGLGSGQLWNGGVGVRMAPWFNQSFGFGEQSGTTISYAVGKTFNSFSFVADDIIGVVINPDSGAVNFYKNGDFLATLRNTKAVGKILHVFIQNYFSLSGNALALTIEALTTASSYVTNYYFASDSLDQDASIGLSGEPINVVGSKTKTLTVNSGQVNTYDLRCKVTHPRAHNSPITTNAVQLDVVDSADKNFLNFEYYPTNNGTQATLETVDLQDTAGSGPFYTINRDTPFSNIVFYSPDKDLNVELEMFGPRLNEFATPNANPGNGGYSVIRFTALRNIEYAIAGSQLGGFFVYEQASLLAVVGSGGVNGIIGNGGDGGGVSNPGNNGDNNFQGSGRGGAYISPGQLGQNGVSGSAGPLVQPQDINPKANAPKGGRANNCPIGVYWAQQGFSPCEDIGLVRYRHADGTEVLNSTSNIVRGWKPGTGGYRANRGGSDLAGRLTIGAGGFGATGGEAGNFGGGGGGSGYHAPNVNVISSITGGSDLDVARLVFKTFKPVTKATVSHWFNGANRTSTFSFSGAITATPVAASPQASNGWSNAAGNINAKHYIIDMNDNYSSLNIANFVGWTGGGGQFDTGMQLGAVEKIGPSRWRIWFNRGSGFNTYVRNFTVEGIR